jgi:prepilin-type N-terminal cleavage/methylation domain-containing protein
MSIANPRPEPGFTLLEVLVAMTILGIIMLTVYGALSRTLASKEYAEARGELYAAGRSAVLKMADDLEAALPPSPHSDVSFRGLDRGGRQPEDAIQFSVRTHSGFQQAAPRSGRSTITYSLAPLANSDKLFTVRRDEVPLVANADFDESQAPEDAPPPPKPTSAYLFDETDCNEQRFCVIGLSFHYLDPKTAEWVDVWDSTEPAHLNVLPLAVDIGLTLIDGNGNAHDFSTIVDLVLSIGTLPTPTPH